MARATEAVPDWAACGQPLERQNSCASAAEQVPRKFFAGAFRHERSPTAGIDGPLVSCSCHCCFNVFPRQWRGILGKPFISSTCEEEVGSHWSHQSACLGFGYNRYHMHLIPRTSIYIQVNLQSLCTVKKPSRKEYYNKITYVIKHGRIDWHTVSHATCNLLAYFPIDGQLASQFFPPISSALGPKTIVNGIEIGRYFLTIANYACLPRLPHLLPA